MQITNISEAKASLSRLIERVQNTNNVIIIGKAGKPVAILSAFKANPVARTLGGSWEGKVRVLEGDEQHNEGDCDEWTDAFYSSVLKA